MLVAACAGDGTGPSIHPLTITTAATENAVLNEAYAQGLEANGGRQPYSWAITAGSLPPGLDLDTSTGEISGIPPALADNDFTVEVSSADGQSSTQDFTIGVFTALEITTTSLPGAVQNSPYDATLTGSGGDGSHTWALAAGSLPAGLSLEPSTGVISGTPTSIGSSQITFELSSGDGQAVVVELSIDVYGELTITTSSLRSAVQGVEYTNSVAVAGGDGSYSWSLANGSLPSGLTLGPSDGLISGTPTIVETQAFTVVVESGDGQTGQVGLSVSVYPLLEVTTTSLGDGTQAIPYADSVEASGGDGVYSWTVVGGALPEGLSLGSTTGRISGVPTSLGFSYPRFQVASGDGQTAQAVLSIAIAAQILQPGELCADHPPQSVTTFEDPNLEDAIRAELGIGAQSVLTCELVAGLSLLNAENAGITSLLGIQNLVGLIELGLGENSIADLTPLEGLMSLEKLFLQTNAITDVTPLSGLTNLGLLWLGGNSITDITPLAGLTGLGTLLLQTNSITDITPLAGLTGLTSLGLAVNPITDLSTVGGLTNLEQLDLGKLSITDISFLSGLTNLVGLALNQNLVTDLSPLSGLVRLTQLSLNSNYVTDLSPLSGLTNLEDLLVGRNVISDISPLGGLAALTRLELSSNIVTAVAALEGLTALVQLYLDENAGLADIQALLDNVGLGTGDYVWLSGTSVSCTDVGLLEAKGVTVDSACP